MTINSQASAQSVNVGSAETIWATVPDGTDTPAGPPGGVSTPGGGAGSIPVVPPFEPLSCDECGNTDEDTDADAGPEYCGCCDDTLCERCWAASHMLFMR